MFETLTDKLSETFDRLSGRGVLSAKDVEEAMTDVRAALLDADVALPVVRAFIARAKEQAVGEEVVRSIRPADQVVKIVHDGLVEMLGGDGEPVALNLAANPPVVILMAGLQGSGKTTTSAKLALRLSKVERKKVMMASLDTRRPAAMEQLAQLGKLAEVETLPIVAGQSAVEIARRALSAARLGGYDVLILDTAGRTTLDEAMMAEAAEIAKISSPTETLLVADSLTGQDAVRTAKAFHERLPLTGLILTRADGDGRGGAALSMREVTGLPIKFLGAGEKIDALDPFDARRVAGRILGMGDVVGLVEKAAAEMDAAKAERMARRAMSGAAWPCTMGRKLAPACSASMPSCSMAAGRRVSSEASRTFLRSFTRRSASLPAVVVLPEPCRPAIRITVGGFSEMLSPSGSAPPPSISTRPS